MRTEDTMNRAELKKAIVRGPLFGGRCANLCEVSFYLRQMGVRPVTTEVRAALEELVAEGRVEATRFRLAVCYSTVGGSR
jgi:hypothetical protein